MEYIEASEVSDKALNVATPEQAAVLIENAACTRDKAVIGIFVDSTLRTPRYVGTGARILR